MARQARGSDILLTVYSHSLSMRWLRCSSHPSLLHLFGSLHLANDEAMRMGQTVETVLQHIGSPQYWFESFQNWQSEFFALASSSCLRSSCAGAARPIEAGCGP